MTAIAPTPQQGDARAVIAADRLYSHAGAAAITYDVVAVDAGLDVALVRQQYPMVLDLVVAVLQYRQEQWLTGLAEASADVSEPREEILTLFSYLEACFLDEAWRGCAFINGYGELGRTEPVIALLAEAHLDSIEAHLRALCAVAELPAFVADGLSLLVQGAKVEAAIHGATGPARSARMTAAMLMSVYDRDHAEPSFI